MADPQTTTALLRELNSKLTLEITKIRKKFEEQDRKNKTDIVNLINENTELKFRVSRLEQKLSQNDEEKGDLIAKLDNDTPEQKENIPDNIPEVEYSIL
ncbi:hypothetical protein C2G38_2186368 [Gigaspora rosea]|uniref:Uncharacterized protein n=1 Tax=Gigaspora rosea TaxID=44941 RepID=A0A397V8Y5_9GLOM|nr:hypothetical protein C2G38_2186368 [Gigaspora rosea]CAG8538110.1 3691_t:CDS:2 [Gigaspora rosea]